MNREQFLHVVRAAAELVDDELVVIGSQAIIVTTPAPPAALLRSMEVDLYPRTQPSRAAEIDGSLGDGSRFFETFGYYAHGVGPETVIGPAGWEGRLVKFDLPPMRKTDGTLVGWSLSLPDLALAKLAAGRERDVEFVVEMLRADLLDADQLCNGVDYMPDGHREDVRERVKG